MERASEMVAKEDGRPPGMPPPLTDSPPRRIRNLIEVESDRPSRGLFGRLFERAAPSATEISASFRSLGLLLSCGIPVDRSLRLLAASSASPRLRSVFTGAAERVDGGASLSESLGGHGDALSSLLFPLLEAGEATGDMAGVLNRFADLMENRSRREMRTRTALVYPLFLFAICLLVIIFLPTFLLQGLFQLMGQMQVETPFITRCVMVVAGAMRNPLTWLAVGGGLLALASAWRGLIAAPQGRRRVDAMILRIPLVGVCARQVAVTHFVSTLEALISSGISSMTAVELAARATGNLEMGGRLAAACPSLARGQSLHEALEATGCLPPLATQFIAAGEESGRLPELLARIAQMTEDEVGWRLDSALAALEPLMLWFMGCLVGIVCLATLQPFVNVVESLDR